MPTSLELLRLRLAYGESGNQPRYAQKFTPLTVQSNLEGASAQRLRGVLGNPNIRPERQREFDFGIDAIAFDGRAVLELSVYQKTISDLLLEQQVANSTGFLTDFINGGVLRNRGFEAMLQVSPVRSGSFEWLTRTDLLPQPEQDRRPAGPRLPDRGLRRRAGLVPHRAGEVGHPDRRARRACWPTASAASIGKLGDGEPDFRMTFFQGVTWGRFGISALLDWQKGSNIINLTKFLYDLGRNTRRLHHRRAGSADAPAHRRRRLHRGRQLPQAAGDRGCTSTCPPSWVSQLGPMKTARLSLAAPQPVHHHRLHAASTPR